MIQPVVIILGGNKLNRGIADYCKQNGYFVVVVDWSPNAAIKGDLFLCIDVKEADQIITALCEHGITEIMGAYSSIDLAVRSVNAINAHYGLCHMSPSALVHALPKSEMTRIWQENGLLNRISKVYNDYSQEIQHLCKLTKLIIKPNVSSSSRGITIIEKGSEESVIKEAFTKAQKESFDGFVIVEEFVEGREFTCDMLGDKDGNVSVYAISVKYHTVNTANNKIAIKLHYNSNVYPNEVYERIAEVGKQCYKALGFKASFGHLEILMKPNGTLSPVEIGARSSGFITNPLVTLASGHNYLADYFRVLHGESISGKDYINGFQSSMYFFYDMPHDTECMHPCSLMDFLPKEIESRYFDREKVLTQGTQYANIANDNQRIGYEILTGPREVLTIETVENAEKQFIERNTKQ